MEIVKNGCVLDSFRKAFHTRQVIGDRNSEANRGKPAYAK